jgi:hypothetical protein
MKKLSQRSVLLFGVMLVVCALVPSMASMASAASWFQVGTTHQLFSPNLAFTAHTSPLGGGAGWQCNASEFDADVVNTNTLEITDGRFVDCHGLVGTVIANCTVTSVPTNFPWTATATSTTDIQIHGIRVDILFENTPGNANSCSGLGAKSLWTGTLTGGSWNPASNDVLLANGRGLTMHFLGLGGPSFSETTVAGTIRDTAGTLRMFM